MAKLILHIDMDAFFAAVEQRDHPEYRERPVIVGALPGERGVVSTCSYEARRYGIHSAMPISFAYQRCPQGIYVRPNMALYAAVSDQVMAILDRFSPLVEPISIDEAFLDITGLEKLFGEPPAIGRLVKESIARELKLSASVGIGPNRLIAKLASDWEKPDGLTIIAPDQVDEWLAPMPVKRLRGVGPKFQQALARLGIRTVGQLRAWPRPSLVENFGEKGAETLYRQARGQASDVVGVSWERKSISKEITFNEDQDDVETLRAAMLELAAAVGCGARREEKTGRVITLKIRLAGFETHTRQVGLDCATAGDRTIFREAWRLYEKSGFAGRKVRLLGIGLSGFASEECGQMDMPFASDKRDEKIFAAVDRLTQKYGRRTIGLGGVGCKKRPGKDGSGYEPEDD